MVEIAAEKQLARRERRERGKLDLSAVSLSLSLTLSGWHAASVFFFSSPTAAAAASHKNQCWNHAEDIFSPPEAPLSQS